MDPLLFNSQDRTDLANLIMDFVTPEVLEQHCNYTDIMGNLSYNIHDEFNFLPFHRTYLEKLEDFLLEQGRPEFVPLPKWTGLVAPPVEFSLVGNNGVDPDCGAAECANAPGPGIACSQSINWNATVNLPQNITLPIQPGPNNDLCDWDFTPSTFTVINNECCLDGISRRIESPWHNQGHGNTGGAMGFFRSPAVAIFWLWHAAVDDKWKEWECNCTSNSTNTTKPIDLYMKDNEYVVDHERDRGEEPGISDDPMWTSKDIWVRKGQDGYSVHEHENPEYYALPNNFNYVYVQVRNRGCIPSIAGDELKVYWSKAGSALSYPSHWNNTLTTTNGDPVGAMIDVPVILPSIAPGGSYIAEIPWQPENPENYVNIDNSTDPLFWISEPQPHHFCLLARLEAGTNNNDPISFTNGTNISDYTIQNNNVVWKNISVVDFDENNIGGGGGWTDDKVIGATIMVGDAWGQNGTYDLEFTNPDHYKGNPVTAEAEVKITLSPHVWEKWEDGGFQADNIQISREERFQLIVTQSPARIKNLNFDAHERNLVHVGFNFLSKQLSGQKLFDFHLIQRRSADNKIMGGETYHIKVPGRTGFYADAGGDKQISVGESADLNAYSIGEDAIYNWYDPTGVLIYTGMDMTVTPEISKEYKLEVIAEVDGVKDYDKVIVNVKEFEITYMAPNPATAQVSIQYKTENATSAYLIITMPYGSSSNHILDISQTETFIDVSSYQSGAYNVILVCNGIAVDAQTLIVQ